LNADNCRECVTKVGSARRAEAGAYLRRFGVQSQRPNKIDWRFKVPSGRRDLLTHGHALRFALSWLMLLFAAGCTPQPAVTVTTPTARTKTEAAGDLTLALESLRKLAEGRDEKPAVRTIFYLNQWLSSEPAASEAWKPDRLLESLPRAFRSTPGLDSRQLERLQFHGDDFDDLQFVQFLQQNLLLKDFAFGDNRYIQQNLWLRDIAQRVRREPPPARWQAWFKEIEKSVGLPESEQLMAAERLLDWTTRNIQLDPLPPIPKAPEATAGSTETILPAARGEVGPGYGHLPYDILRFGHGDAHERARIFILLCRQLGIDAVMLGFQEEQSSARRGWIPAAFVGGELYLFDTALGLPVPGPEGKGITTFNQVQKDPQLLRQLDVAGLPAYPVTEKDLKGVFAMIDAEPEALSRRMQLLQAAMPASSRIALATQPSKLESELRKTNKTLSGVALWHVPFEAVLYHHGHLLAAARDPQVGSRVRVLNALFSPERPLVKARNFHFQARYENEDQKFAARSLYLQCRPPDREIDAMTTNEFYRKAVGIDQALPPDPAQRQAMLDFYTEIAREGKFDATYRLGLTYYEAGKYDTAVEWLGARTVQVSPPSPWTAGARYNLARCYEQLGNVALARQWLESDKDSPQRHGNLLRSKMLLAEADAR
jgi:tetratricopeptide (TPR) repeat protein